MYSHELRTQQEKLVRPCSPCQCLPFDRSSRNHQHGIQTANNSIRRKESNQAGGQESTKARRKTGKWGKWAWSHWRVAEPSDAVKYCRKEKVRQNSKWIVIGKLKQFYRGTSHEWSGPIGMQLECHKRSVKKSFQTECKANINSGMIAWKWVRNRNCWLRKFRWRGTSSWKCSSAKLELIGQ